MDLPVTHWPATLFAGRRYAVLGLGRNGLPAANALAAMGADVTAWDDAGSGAGLDAAVAFQRLDDMAGFDALVLSPGIPHTLPTPHPVAAAARAAGVPILSDADLLYQAVRAAGSQARFVGVTGTNGKSTTTALIAHMLEGAGLPVAAGGNLGPAALALPLLESHGVYVLELSSYMLERIAALRFNAVVMLNISPDHLDRHGDLAGYAAVKASILSYLLPDGTAVVGMEDAASRAIAAQHPGALAADLPTELPADMTLPRSGETLRLDMRVTRALPGRHNLQNAVAAALVVDGLIADPVPAIAAGIRFFPGLPHRQQRVAVVDGVPWIDDSKATNADSAAWALGCYDHIVWIAGGVAKAGGIAPLAAWFPRIAHALLIGQAAEDFAATLAAAGVPHTVCGTLEAAAPAARDAAARLGADAVLLSPACASFDQFTGFEARGRRFAELAEGMH